MALVLCIGSQTALMETRRVILEGAGHRVVSAMSILDLEQVCSRNNFDVAVIGEAVPPKEKLRVSDLVRHACPAAKVLELHRIPGGRALENADDWLVVSSDVPSNVAVRVTALANRKTSRPKKRSAARRSNS